MNALIINSDRVCDLCNNCFNVQIAGQQHLYVVFPKIFPGYHLLCVFDFTDTSFEEWW